MKLNTPLSTVAVSVVIPMFNAEKYIGAMLDSLLAQTFTDFEVIIADDCSTDSSAAIVESYADKFNGRLKLSRMKKNSGAPGAPTNRAVALAVGKYIYQVDNDDALANVALEQLYTAAENFNADVVQTTRFFYFDDDAQSPDKLPETFQVTEGLVDEVAFLTDNVGERMKILCDNITLGVTGWQKFVRRDLLVENKIVFPENMKCSHDIIWTIEWLFHAERYLVIPQPLYFHRLRTDSLSHSKRVGALGIEHWGNWFAVGAQHLCSFFAAEKFFHDEPQCAYMLLDWYVKMHENFFVTAISGIDPPDAQRVLEKILSADFGEHCGLISHLCTSLNVARLNQRLLTAHVNELEQKLRQFTDTAK